ncbi:MAG: DNA-binding protein [Parachlamydiales bacterium]|nr:DNA-binding protein [Parachlamydiales bacterium]
MIGDQKAQKFMYFSKCNAGYVLRLEIGEEIQEAMRQFAQAVDIKGAFYQGIGTLTQVELAFFCTDSKAYDRRFFDQNYEISLSGNLSAHDGVIVPHTHVTLSDKNFHTYSGHLVRGVVSATVEVMMTQLDIALTRKEDPIMKIKGLISPKRTHLVLK